MGESATAMSGAKGEGMWGMDKVDDSEPQKRTYFMWVNTKLEEGGHSRIGFDSMWVDFKNGVVLANLVSSLCDVKASKKFPDDKINYNPRNPLHDNCNVRLVFEFLEKVEGEDLSGIPVNTITKGSEHCSAQVMGLIFKLILRYSIADKDNMDMTAFKALLEWVQPKCIPDKDVKNFDGSWKDGKALVALWNTLVNDYHPEYKMDTNKLDQDDHGTIQWVIDEFHNKMGVESYITPHMMLDQRPDKNSMMTYISEIRDKHRIWMEEEERQKKLADENDNADNQFIANADKWYKMGCDKTKETNTESNETYFGIEAFANENMSARPIDDFDTICEEARQMLGPIDDGYDESTTYFNNAATEYKKVKDRTKKKDALARKKQCLEKIEKNEDLDDNIHKKVDKLLEDLRKKWEAKKSLEYAIEFFSNESTTTEEKVKDIIDKTTRSFTEFNYDRQRFQAVETGRTEVMEVIESMDKAKHLFEETEPKMIDEEDRETCTEKMVECDDLKATWLQMYDDACKAELDKDIYVSYEETTDLLEQYHNFSVELETIISTNYDEEGNAIAPIDDGHSDIKDVRSRLDQLNSMLKGFKEKERDLREMVQNAVDEQFDAENLPGAHWYKANYDAVVV